MSIKKSDYVKGKTSPFVHGKVSKTNKIWTYLEDGGVYVTSSLSKIKKKEEQTLPNFHQFLRESVSGLNILKK
jgi:hypothetical protein